MNFYLKYNETSSKYIQFHSNSNAWIMTKLCPLLWSCWHSQSASEAQSTRRPPPNTRTCEPQRSQKPQYREETQTHMHAVIQEAMRPTSKNIILISTRPQQGVRKQVGCITTQSQLQNVTGNTHTHFYRHTCSTSRPHVSTAMLWKHSEHLINSCALTQCRHQLTNTVAFKRETAGETASSRHSDTNNTNRQRCTQTHGSADNTDTNTNMQKYSHGFQDAQGKKKTAVHEHAKCYIYAGKLIETQRFELKILTQCSSNKLIEAARHQRSTT